VEAAAFREKSNATGDIGDFLFALGDKVQAAWKKPVTEYPRRSPGLIGNEKEYFKGMDKSRPCESGIDLFSSDRTDEVRFSRDSGDDMPASRENQAPPVTEKSDDPEMTELAPVQNANTPESASAPPSEQSRNNASSSGQAQNGESASQNAPAGNTGRKPGLTGGQADNTGAKSQEMGKGTAARESAKSAVAGEEIADTARQVLLTGLEKSSEATGASKGSQPQVIMAEKSAKAGTDGQKDVVAGTGMSKAAEQALAKAVAAGVRHESAASEQQQDTTGRSTGNGTSARQNGDNKQESNGTGIAGSMFEGTLRTAARLIQSHSGTEAPSGNVFRETLPGFTSNIGRYLMSSAENGGKEVTILLVPGELGRIKLFCRESAEGMTVQIRAENPEACGLLQGQSAAIRTALEGKGYAMTRLDIGVWSDAGNGEQQNRGGRRENAGESEEAHEGFDRSMESGVKLHDKTVSFVQKSGFWAVA